MKKLIELSLENKSLNHLLFLFLIILSYFSYENVAKEMFPPSSLDQITIQGTYQNSDSTTLDKLIVKDIERILFDNQNLEDINTLISNGIYHINAEIKDNSKKQKTINKIKNQIETLKKDLPNDMDIPNVETIESYFSLLNISISSSSNSNYIEVAKDLIDDIKKLKNLYSVKLNDNYDSLLTITLNDKKLSAYGLAKHKTINEIKALYSLFPIGKINSKKEKYYVNTKNSNLQIEKILNTQIKVDNTLVFVKDIAKIKYVYKERDVITKTNGKESVTINIKKDKRGDSILLSKQIRKILVNYQKEYKDIDFNIIGDSSFWIKTRLNVITSNIIIGLILLFFAIWLFVSLKIALVVILGIPISFAFGLIGLDFFEGSLNTLSMIGVLLTLGILVDEAIVVSENIHRHQVLGKDLKQACIDGTMEVMPILFASMLTTIIAFTPLLMLSGGLGVFIKIIPLIVIILVISSFIESFIFLPIHYKQLSFKFLDTKNLDYKDKFWKKLTSYYKISLNYFMKKRYISSVLLIIFTLGSSYYLVKSSRFQLFPEFDAMSINITGKVNHNSLTHTLEKTKELENILISNLNKDNVDSISTIIGMNSDGRSKHEKAENLFTITLNLKQKISTDFFNKYINPIFIPFKDEKNDRTRNIFAKEIKTKVENLLKTNHLNKFQDLKIAIPQTGVVKNDIEISISHNDNKKIKEAIDILKSQMSKIKNVYNIQDDMNFNELKINLDINSYGKNLGFTQTDIINKIRNYISVKELSKIVDKNSNLIQLNLEFSNKKGIENLKNLPLAIPDTNKITRLKEIAKLNFVKSIKNIKKENLQKIFTVSASIKKRKLTSRNFFKKINPTLNKLKEKGLKIIIKGEEKTNNQIRKDILLSLLFAIFGILIVLTTLFSSFRLSLFALSVIPLSILGVLIGHKLMQVNITFSSLLGFVGLIGIVINDTLIMLKFIKSADNKNELLDTASIRLKPILLTSITTILGLATLIFFASGESLLMQPLAISIGFGLLWATIINLYYIPIVYSFNKRFKE